MTSDTNLNDTDGIIATIENRDNPDQAIAIKYLKDQNAFVTSGIQTYFGEKEILIPAYLVAVDFQLIGTIVSAILEKLSQAHEMETTFDYEPSFEVLNKVYALKECGEYMEISVAEE
ncbi:MAG: hypothetical protein J7M30_04870 [Deltaproteobacteria bacterium]|nr:hypothetical protein [Deltaproteobacteria bacterium]